ncbi:hypothetical protein, partial [Streptomyces anulatus]|uniref:hypothetical protein n=1 Tax=Streptomyces anulatus TaxID=1892 RepID=UPI003439C6F0
AFTGDDYVGVRRGWEERRGISGPSAWPGVLNGSPAPPDTRSDARNLEARGPSVLARRSPVKCGKAGKGE